MTIINPGFIDTELTRGNKVEMPYLMSPEYAAAWIITGLKKGKFEIAFPWQIAWMYKVVRVLPYPIYLLWLKAVFGKGRA